MYPNPSRGVTSVEFYSLKDDRVRLEVFDVHGSIIAQLYSGGVDAKTIYQVQLDGAAFKSGMYFIRLSSGKESVVEKLIKQ